MANVQEKDLCEEKINKNKKVMFKTRNVDKAEWCVSQYLKKN